MPLYARADVMSVSIGQAHGGCGNSHTRPVVQGAPVKIWKLACSQCQGYLANDPLWSGNLADIPSTPDEERGKENADILFARNRDDVMTMALARIAGMPAGDLMKNVAIQTAEQGTVRCSDGHDNFPTAHFCGECGIQLGVIKQPVSTAAVTAEAPSPAPVVEPTAVSKPVRQPRQSREMRETRPARVIPPVGPTSLEDDISSVPSI